MVTAMVSPHHRGYHHLSLANFAAADRQATARKSALSNSIVTHQQTTPNPFARSFSLSSYNPDVADVILTFFLMGKATSKSNGAAKDSVEDSDETISVSEVSFPDDFLKTEIV